MATTKPMRRRALVAALSTTLLGTCFAVNAATPDETQLLTNLAESPSGDAVLQHRPHAHRRPLRGLDERQRGLCVGQAAALLSLWSSVRYQEHERPDRPETGAGRQGKKPDEAPQKYQPTTASPIRFEQLPLSDAIKTVHGTGQRRVAVFSDPNCPYCKQLEAELAGLDNITIYTFLLPFLGETKPIAVWCAADRTSAWRRLMLDGDDSLLNTATACDHPIGRNLALARQLGVQGTPTLIWADGTRSEGFVGRAVIESRLAPAASQVVPEKQP
jgi:thiol:disulfide interchange protein DsbC